MKNKLSDTKSDISFVDIETTGLNFLKHEIIDIAVLKVNQPKFEILETWQTKVKPLNLKTASPEALKLTGFNKTDWKKAIHPKEALKTFAQKTEATIIAGQCPWFDRLFLEKSALRWKIKLETHYHMIDTFSIAYSKLQNTDLEKFGLSSLAEYFKVEQINAHTALDDVRVTFEIFKKLIEI